MTYRDSLLERMVNSRSISQPNRPVLGEGIPDYLNRKFKRRGSEGECSSLRRGEQSRPAAPQVAATTETLEPGWAFRIGITFAVFSGEQPSFRSAGAARDVYAEIRLTR